MRLPEVHIWRDRNGMVERVEFHDGPQRMEMKAVSRLRTEQTACDPGTVEFTVIAKPIYHDPEAAA